MTLVQTKLYKIDSKGKIRVFEVWIKPVEDDICFYKIILFTGIYGGNLIEKEISVFKGKQGRTIKEQAILEANHRYKKKRDEGYKALEDFNWEGENVEEFILNNFPIDATDANDLPKPMLATPHNKVKFDNKQYIVQPKLNGVRCLMIGDGITVNAVSRQGKNYNFATTHIREILESIEFKGILDGELYNHDLPLQVISGLVRTTKTEEKDFSVIQYHVYDLINSFSQQFRIGSLSDLFCRNNKTFDQIIIHVESFFRGPDRFKQIHDEFVDQGYEGLIIRNPDGKYENKRSKNLIKYKNFIDEEFDIVGVSVNEKQTVGDSFVFILITKEGRQFKARPLGTREEKEYWYNNPSSWNGKKATVRYFELTVDKIPHQARVVTVRDYEN